MDPKTSNDNHEFKHRGEKRKSPGLSVETRKSSDQYDSSSLFTRRSKRQRIVQCAESDDEVDQGASSPEDSTQEEPIRHTIAKKKSPEKILKPFVASEALDMLKKRSEIGSVAHRKQSRDELTHKVNANVYSVFAFLLILIS